MRLAFLALWFFSLAAVAWLSLQPQPEFPVEFWNADKLYHLGAYFVLALLGIQSFTSKRGRLAAVLITIAFGVGIEFLQGLVPGRLPSFWDGVANAAGVGLAWSARRFSK
ncbi:putative integral membrane protein [Desulfocurvibacter africanus PCS]|uniref:Putative integral membrane protein n=1 Tax=Desulfocurvibacter africanus PCS TaxID=1262666 RepID=M5Q1K1_DESAF|nr:VanZ family protein [Desulfocurvibacter africanus]EMG36623.1 putative integral membrane protein [Desulfocurvibacter africanus PCS]